MKKSLWLLLTLVLLCAAAPAQADKSPLVQALGSEQAARHLATHIYARKDHWDGTLPFFCPDETCKDYGHVRLTGRRVTLWDSPGKGDSRVAYYPNGTTNKVGPDTEFELTNVVAYKGKYYANIRITDDHGVVVNSGSSTRIISPATAKAIPSLKTWMNMCIASALSPSNNV